MIEFLIENKAKENALDLDGCSPKSLINKLGFSQILMPKKRHLDQEMPGIVKEEPVAEPINRQIATPTPRRTRRTPTLEANVSFLRSTS